MDISNDEPSLPSTSAKPQISEKLENKTLSYLEDLGPCSSEQSKSKAAANVENQKQENELERSIRLEYEEEARYDSDERRAKLDALYAEAIAEGNRNASSG